MVDSVGIKKETKTGQNVIKKTVDYAEKAASHLGPTSSFMSLAKNFLIVPLYFLGRNQTKEFC